MSPTWRVRASATASTYLSTAAASRGSTTPSGRRSPVPRRTWPRATRCCLCSPGARACHAPCLGGPSPATLPPPSMGGSSPTSKSCRRKGCPRSCGDARFRVAGFGSSAADLIQSPVTRSTSTAADRGLRQPRSRRTPLCQASASGPRAASRASRSRAVDRLSTGPCAISRVRHEWRYTSDQGRHPLNATVSRVGTVLAARQVRYASALLAVPDRGAPLAVVEPAELAFEKVLELLRGTAAGLPQCGRMVGDGHRLLPGRSSLQHAPLASPTGLAGALVAQMGLHPCELVAEPRQRSADLGFDVTGQFVVTFNVVVRVDLDLHLPTPSCGSLPAALAGWAVLPQIFRPGEAAHLDPRRASLERRRGSTRRRVPATPGRRRRAIRRAGPSSPSGTGPPYHRTAGQKPGPSGNGVVARWNSVTTREWRAWRPDSRVRAEDRAGDLQRTPPRHPALSLV